MAGLIYLYERTRESVNLLLEVEIIGSSFHALEMGSISLREGTRSLMLGSTQNCDCCQMTAISRRKSLLPSTDELLPAS